jgi:hypothetical protein
MDYVCRELRSLLYEVIEGVRTSGVSDDAG